jgi:hypothetical protein
MLPVSPVLASIKRVTVLPIHAVALPGGSGVFRALLDRSTSSNPLLVARPAGECNGSLYYSLAAQCMQVAMVVREDKEGLPAEYQDHCRVGVGVGQPSQWIREGTTNTRWHMAADWYSSIS